MGGVAGCADFGPHRAAGSGVGDGGARCIVGGAVMGGLGFGGAERCDAPGGGDAPLRRGGALWDAHARGGGGRCLCFGGVLGAHV